MNKKVKSTEVSYDKNLRSLHMVLLKKAMGYKIKETVDEFVVIDDEVKLTKRKVNVKYYPPDLNAIELLLQKNNDFTELRELTNEELEEEKLKLMKKLKLFKNAEYVRNKEKAAKNTTKNSS